MFRMNGLGNIHGGQNRKDKRLNQSDKDLKGHHHHGHRKGKGSDDDALEHDDH